MTTTHRERGIPFKGHMVEAILAGRKGQTRRIVERQDELPKLGEYKAERVDLQADGMWRWLVGLKGVNFDGHERRCPYGVVGDLLYIRELLRINNEGEWYRDADKSLVQLLEGDDRIPWMISWAYHKQLDYCPSIHMPKFAARSVRLEITGLRVERLLAITEDDARAEGLTFDGQWWLGAIHPVKGTRKVFSQARDAFLSMWDEINGERAPVETNPWVWVVEFKVLHAEAKAA